MEKLQEKIQLFFDSLGLKEVPITFIPATVKDKYTYEPVITLLEELPKITAFFKKYHGVRKGETVEVGAITQADLKITTLMNVFIQKTHPHDLVIGEEEETTFVDNSKGLVILDPIDGTKNFAEGKHDCCFAFVRLENERDSFQKGYALLWEPFNEVLTIGIWGLGVFVCGRTIAKHDGVIASVKSFSFEKHKQEYGTKILEPVFDNIEYAYLGSGSVQYGMVVASHIDILIREQQKIWDCVPGAYISFLIGKPVFYHDSGKDLFPITISQIKEVLKNAQSKDDRRMQYVTVCSTKDMKQKIVESVNKEKIK